MGIDDFSYDEPTAPNLNRVVEAFHAALSEGNAEKAISYLDPYASIFEQGGIETRGEYEAGHLARDIEFIRGKKRIIRSKETIVYVEVSGICLSAFTVVDAADPHTVLDVAETMVLTFGSSGEWRIRHIHWSVRQETSQKAPGSPKRRELTHLSEKPLG